MTDEPGRRESEPRSGPPPAEPGVGAPEQPARDAGDLYPGGAPTAEQPSVPETVEQPPVPETVEQPPVAETVEQSAAEEPTVVDQGPSGTSVLPTVPMGAPESGPPPVWSARASVRPPRVDDLREAPPQGWGQPEPPRSVAMPILMTAAALILLLILGIGIYLLLHAGREVQVPPTVTPVPTVASTVPRVTTPPRPTTAPPTTTAAVLVRLPDLTGVDYNSAFGQLTDLGLFVTRVDEVSADIPAGQVIRTEPGAEQRVPVQSVVKVVVSSGPPAVTTSASPSSPPAT